MMAFIKDGRVNQLKKILADQGLKVPRAAEAILRAKAEERLSAINTHNSSTDEQHASLQPPALAQDVGADPTVVQPVSPEKLDPNNYSAALAAHLQQQEQQEQERLGVGSSRGPRRQGEVTRPGLGSGTRSVADDSEEKRSSPTSDGDMQGKGKGKKIYKAASGPPPLTSASPPQTREGAETTSAITQTYHPPEQPLASASTLVTRSDAEPQDGAAAIALPITQPTSIPAATANGQPTTAAAQLNTLGRAAPRYAGPTAASRAREVQGAQASGTPSGRSQTSGTPSRSNKPTTPTTRSHWR
jgi:hypothetical protein